MKPGAEIKHQPDSQRPLQRGMSVNQTEAVTVKVGGLKQDYDRKILKLVFCLKVMFAGWIHASVGAIHFHPEVEESPKISCRLCSHCQGQAHSQLCCDTTLKTHNL